MLAKKQKKSDGRHGSDDGAKSTHGIRAGGKRAATALIIAIAISIVLSFLLDSDQDESLDAARQNSIPADADESESASTDGQERLPVRIFNSGNLTMFWDKAGLDLRQFSPTSASSSNIAPKDYAGPEACADCHKQNHDAWTHHPHRWMNALANAQSVKGDFSDKSVIQYRGGVGRFYRAGERYLMSFDREDDHREYEITQTIGSRFYQYYVGKGIVGPEPEEHEYYRMEFVLPFGYWLQRQAWVPIVHVAEELPEGERWESTETLKPPESQRHGELGVGIARGDYDDNYDVALIYTRSCNSCHTTFALGEMFVRNPKLLGPDLPRVSLFAFSDYLAETRPEIWDGSQPPEKLASETLDQITTDFMGFDARHEGVSLGISCEACHLGCQSHATNEARKPAFAPHSPHLLTMESPSQIPSGRTRENVNAICARCHVGNRPKYAAGMATWNSTEYTDAMRGSCYSELTCVHCHDPHSATGLEWPKSPKDDDASCLACHGEFKVPAVREQHTHHRAGSPGDRCMDCHMPKINEGMQDVVRTHTIFSPTQADMIEANQPNACNLCHLDRSIDWTVNYLTRWYGRTYSSAAIDRSYSDPAKPVGMGWLEQAHAPTRLVAAEAFARQKATWGLPHLIIGLDDPYLLNRQFFQESVEALTGQLLSDTFGYWYYMTPEERQPIIERIREALLEN